MEEEKMTREEQLQQIAKDLYEAKIDEKEASEGTRELRNKFFRLCEEGFRGKDHLLPVKTIEVPDSFFDATGYDKEEFPKSRFPGWDVYHQEYDAALEQTIYILRRNPSFIPGVVEVRDEKGLIRVSKEISEYTPEIDWDSLRAERPDLYKQIVKRRIEYDVNEDAFQKMVEEDPESLAVIFRHQKVREPTIRATARRVKDGN
jgi:hypothetical protein